MYSTSIFLVAIIYLFAKSEALMCDQDWILLKDAELCIREYTDVIAHMDSETFCSNQGIGSSLLLIKENDDNNIVVCQKPAAMSFEEDYISEVETIRRELRGSLTERNERRWGEIQSLLERLFNVILDKLDLHQTIQKLQAKEFEEVKRQLLAAQNQIKELQDGTNTGPEDIIAIRKDLHETRRALNTTQGRVANIQRDIQTTNQNLQRATATIVPVGSVYIEYNHLASPRSLWPSMRWQDISGTYAGQFFRVIGGGSAPWGTTQQECAPRITRMSYNQRKDQIYSNSISIPANGWSQYGQSGFEHPGGTFNGEGIRFHTEGCPVRPRNIAIRIWRRTA